MSRRPPAARTLTLSAMVLALVVVIGIAVMVSWRVGDDTAGRDALARATASAAQAAGELTSLGGDGALTDQEISDSLRHNHGILRSISRDEHTLTLVAEFNSYAPGSAAQVNIAPCFQLTITGLPAQAQAQSEHLQACPTSLAEPSLNTTTHSR